MNSGLYALAGASATATAAAWANRLLRADDEGLEGVLRVEPASGSLARRAPGLAAGAAGRVGRAGTGVDRASAARRPSGRDRLARASAGVDGRRLASAGRRRCPRLGSTDDREPRCSRPTLLGQRRGDRPRAAGARARPWRTRWRGEQRGVLDEARARVSRTKARCCCWATVCRGRRARAPRRRPVAADSAPAGPSAGAAVGRRLGRPGAVSSVTRVPSACASARSGHGTAVPSALLVVAVPSVPPAGASPLPLRRRPVCPHVVHNLCTHGARFVPGRARCVASIPRCDGRGSPRRPADANDAGGPPASGCPQPAAGEFRRGGRSHRRVAPARGADLGRWRSRCGRAAGVFDRARARVRTVARSRRRQPLRRARLGAVALDRVRTPAAPAAAAAATRPATVPPQLAVREPTREQAHLPAEQPPSRQDPRLPAAHAHPRRPRDPRGAAAKGRAELSA